MENKLFYYGLVLSFMIHLSLVGFLSLSKTQQLQEAIKNLEVTYQQAVFKKSVEEMERTEAKNNDKLKFFKKIELPTEKPYLDDLTVAELKDVLKLNEPRQLPDKNMAKVNIFDLERKVSVPFIETEKITNPQYLSYNDKVRAQIKQRAYSYVDHPEFENGEVYVTFILSSQGMLKDLKIKEDKTLANSYLREVSIRSVQESNPFPAFPKGFDYPEFTFNVLISYQK